MMLGETRRESFYLCLNDDSRDQKIYPVISTAFKHIHIQGPDNQGAGKRWIIDGRDEETPAGVVYGIRFAWRASRLLIDWEEIPPSLASESTRQLKSYAHTFCIRGSSTAWKFQNMRKVEAEDGVWECSVRIGLTGGE